MDSVSTKNEHELRRLLEAFHSCTGLPLRFLDGQGECGFSIGKEPDFCSVLTAALGQDDGCRAHLVSAAADARQQRQSCFFSCGCGLSLLAVPLLRGETAEGTVLVGPFLTAEPDRSLITELDKKYSFSCEILLELAAGLPQVRVLSPAAAEQLSFLLTYLLAGLTGSAAPRPARIKPELRAGRGTQPAAVNRADKYPLDKEKALLDLAENGKTEGFQEALDGLLGAILLYERQDTAAVKLRIVELCALLSRTALSRGAEAELIMQTENRLLAAVMNAEDAGQACEVFRENAALFADIMLLSAGIGNRSIRQAADYIGRHYAEALSLEEVAEHIHLNASYLSALFKKATNANFRDYLNKVRIAEAQRLLVNTDSTIVDIAANCGFNDQSYFTKVFKKATGMTPRQYRSRSTAHFE